MDYGAAFTSSRVILPEMDLAYDPILLKDYVNLFLDSGHNWPDKDSDLSLLPIGEQLLNGVNYNIYEYKTALYPHAVTLDGVAKEDDKAMALPEKVAGMKVNRKADALFPAYLTAAGRMETTTQAARREGSLCLSVCGALCRWHDRIFRCA